MLLLRLRLLLLLLLLLLSPFGNVVAVVVFAAVVPHAPIIPQPDPIRPQDMSAILEAYWLLAAKRFVDNVCMTLDKKIMGAVAHKMQGGVTHAAQLYTVRVDTNWCGCCQYLAPSFSCLV